MSVTAAWSQRTAPESGWYRPAMILASVAFLVALIHRVQQRCQRCLGRSDRQHCRARDRQRQGAGGEQQAQGHVHARGGDAARRLGGHLGGCLLPGRPELGIALVGGQAGDAREQEGA